MLKNNIKPYPVNITWMITNRCNYNCKFCFRFTNRKEVNYKQAVGIINKLAKSGTKKISWAGGEPMLWPGMVDLIEYTHSLGLTTMLITNGELITPGILKRLSDNLDWLNLPLDGPDELTSNLMTRKTGHFTRVLNLLSDAQQYGIKTKINTVVSKINKGTILSMWPIINKYSVSRWKLFQFYSIRGYSLANRNQFQINRSDFENIRNSTLSCVDKYSGTIVFESCNELDRSYFSLTPDGSVYVSLKGCDFFIGNLKKDSVAKIWENDMLDKDKYWKRAKWVLNGSGKK